MRRLDWSHRSVIVAAWVSLLVSAVAAPEYNVAEEERFEVKAMLVAAVGGSIGDECVSDVAQSNWVASFDVAVETMLRKTQKAMQQGLVGIAQASRSLAASCPDASASLTPAATQGLKRLRNGAERLEVFATARSGLLNARSSVAYEPLKTVRVAGIDVHVELNALLVAWKLRKGPKTTGEALRDFLRLFLDGDDNEENSGASTSAAPVAAPVRLSVAPAEDPHGRRTPRFWAVALARAFERFGDAKAPITSSCVPAGTADAISAGIEEAFKSMMEKQRRSVQLGLRGLALSIRRALDEVGPSCRLPEVSTGLVRLRSAAARLEVFASARTLSNFGAHVEYEALKVLKVGGVDVHREINDFIGAWMGNTGPLKLGDALAAFLKDFASNDEDAAGSAAVARDTGAPAEADRGDTQDEGPVVTMLRDAVVAASSNTVSKADVAASCFPAEVVSSFEAGVGRAIDHALQKRRRTMQLALKELADATDSAMNALPASCQSNVGVQKLWSAARKLKRLTRRAVVDYGQNIRYEAMKSLSVGGVAVHSEINNFIATWKLQGQQVSGAFFGQFMLKCTQIPEHDEM